MILMYFIKTFLIKHIKISYVFLLTTVDFRPPLPIDPARI